MKGNEKRKPTRHLPEQSFDSYLELMLSEVEAYREPESDRSRIETEDEAPGDENLPDTWGQGEVDRASLERDEPEEQTAYDDGTVSGSLRRSGVEIPAWGQTTFQCLIFKVRDLTLAAPLLALDSIACWQDKITAIPGQPDWHLGVILYRDRHVVAVDTARLIMPDRLGVDYTPGGSHLLIIGEYRWGLACDALQRPVTLNPESVRWRRHDNIEPWIAGIVTEKLCTLLNIEALIKVIN